MRVRGTEYDLVDWDVELFEPGKLFWRPEYQGPIDTDRKRVKVQVPSRFDAVVLDFTRLHPTYEENDYKAGALGFAGALYSTADVEVTIDGKVEADDILAQHIGLLFKEVTGCDGGFKIHTQDHPYRHVGASSSASLVAATANALNILLGKPLDDRQLVRFVAHNYGERSQLRDGYLVPGISTGSSGNLALRGGIGVTSSDCELIGWGRYPEGTNIVLGIPDIPEVGAGPELSQAEMLSLDWARHIGKYNAPKVCYWMMMDFLPALNQGDLRGMGKVLYDTSFGSTKAALMNLYTSDIPNVIMEQQRAGVEGCFMSSAGPGLVALTIDKKDVARDIFKRRGYQVVDVEPVNEGLKIIEEE